MTIHASQTNESIRKGKLWSIKNECWLHSPFIGSLCNHSKANIRMSLLFNGMAYLFLSCWLIAWIAYHFHLMHNESIHPNIHIIFFFFFFFLVLFSFSMFSIYFELNQAHFLLRFVFRNNYHVYMYMSLILLCCNVFFLLSLNGNWKQKI